MQLGYNYLQILLGCFIFMAICNKQHRYLESFNNLPEAQITEMVDATYALPVPMKRA